MTEYEITHGLSQDAPGPLEPVSAPTSHPIPTGATGEDEQSAFERWLERTCPSGDVESVQRQWEASSDYADFQAPAAGDALDVLLLTQALQDLRHAFVIAVGDKSPFARMALEKADAAIAQQKGEA
ncbi:hypothetical protein ELS24_10100 [Achromobacter spanius]|uniref:hypothetical protein n=1 Tax=Achromobacter spanius TaxID=217203 RepID=UPI000F8FA645|nr:hypothetical protein [Achromobacter spanius]AZS78763.1 hypothetical protein ELS24_10100 [Achromobacter spanius]